MSTREDLIRNCSDTLAAILSRGLGKLRSGDVDPALAALRDLGMDGLAKELEGLSITRDANKRFKLVTRALYGLAQTKVSVACLKRATLDTAPRLRDRPWLRVAPRSTEATSSEISELAFAPRKILELHHAVEELDLETAPFARLLPLLAHSELRRALLDAISKLAAERRLVLGTQCIEAQNRLLREAGIEILVGTAGEESASTLLAKLADRSLAPKVAEAVRSHKEAYLHRLVSLLSSERTRLRREAAHLLHACAGKDWADEIHVLAQKEEDPTTRAWLELAFPPRVEGGTVDLRWLKSAAGRTDQHVLRIFAKAALIRENAIGTKYLMAEFNTADPIVFKTTMEAITTLDFPERVLDPLFQELHKAPKASTRRDALRRLLFLDHDMLVPHLLEACRDGNAEVSRMAVEALVERRGMIALERLFDLDPVYGDYASLSPEIRQQVNSRLVPHLVRVGDSRFAPYLARLFEDRIRSGDRYEWRQQLLPLLKEYGEPLVEELGRLLHHEDARVSLAAEELLMDMGSARGSMLLDGFHESRDTVEVALRRLQSPDLLEASTRSLVDEMDDPEVVDRLLSMLDEAKTRKQVIKLFTRLRPPEVLPRLIELLGAQGEEEESRAKPGKDSSFLDGPLDECLLAYGDLARSALVQALDGPRWSARRQAARLLGRVGGPKEGAALGARLAKETDGDVLETIIEALGTLKVLESLNAVAAYTDSPFKELREASYLSLATMGNAAALPPLQDALSNSKDLSERRKVQSALNDLKKRLR